VIRKTPRPLPLIALLLSVAPLVAGQAFAVTRCTDAKGKVTYQDTACEQGAAKSSAVDTSDAFSTKPIATPSASRRPPRQEIHATPPAEPSNPPNLDYATARGAWRGPLQFQVTVDGKRDGAAQAVTPVVIEIAPDGEVKGVIAKAECRLSGLATEFVTPRSASLDVTLKGCKDGRFNARYGGYLHARAGSREATLTLNSVSGLGLLGKIQHASLQAVLKR
jgi:hypothetical protein